MPTNDFPMVDVLRLRPLDGYRLWLRFTDGTEGVRDLSDVMAKGGVMVEPLKVKQYFDRVFVELARRPGRTDSTSIRLISTCNSATPAR